MSDTANKPSPNEHSARVRDPADFESDSFRSKELADSGIRVILGKLEGEDETPYEEAQYYCLAALIATLRRTVASLANADIVGHCDIAPGRKTDPGEAFDWQALESLLTAET